jgi:hypothetical protein
LPNLMTPTISPYLGQITTILAEQGYDVSESAPSTIKIREVDSGVIIQAVLEGDILFLTLPCITVPRATITPEVMKSMLASDNGISTSSFQIYEAGSGKVTVTLNNFCKIQDMGAEDEDDVLSCVHFLLVDVMTARRVLSGLSA